MSFARATVTKTSRLSARLHRIVLHCPDLDRLDVPSAADAAVGVYFPDPGLDGPPTPEYRDGVLGFHDPDNTPEGRNYSIRHHDTATNRITVDVVLHQHGVGTTWAANAKPGHQVELAHARSWYDPETTTDWQLLVTDLSGLPAAARIISELDSQTETLVIAEVLDESDLTFLPSKSNVTVEASVGTGNGASPSVLAERVKARSLPTGRGYCWFAGEAAESRTVRKYFRELGWSARQLDVIGYWRFDSERWDREFALVQDELLPIYERALAEGKGDKAAFEEFDDALEQAGL